MSAWDPEAVGYRFAGAFCDARRRRLRTTYRKVAQTEASIPETHESFLRGQFAEELAAIVWAGNQHGLEESAVAIQARAVALLLTGFRRRLAEIARGEG